MLRYGLSLLVLVIALTGLWYQGLLADFYADYPDRSPVEGFRTSDKPLIVAHRGHEFVAPEDTLAAFAAALERGVDYLEVDMRLTADGVPIVLHDSSVDRTTNGKGQVSKLTFAEVRALDAGSWFADDFSGEKIPTVEEVLELADDHVCILADIKSMPNYRLIKLLRDFAEGKNPICVLVAIYSKPKSLEEQDFSVDEMDPERLRQIEAIIASRTQNQINQLKILRRYWPDFPYLAPLRPGEDMQALLREYPQIVALDLNRSQLTQQQVAAAHAAGVATFSRIPLQGEENELLSAENTPEIVLKLDKAGVDLLFVSDIDYILELLGQGEVASPH